MLKDTMFVNNDGRGCIDRQKGVITLQRRGCAQTLMAGDNLFHVEFMRHYAGKSWHYEVNYGDRAAWGFVHSGQVFGRGEAPSLAGAKIEAAKMVNELLAVAGAKHDYVFSDAVQAYMFNYGVAYDYCSDDQIVSPLYFADGVIYGNGSRPVARWSGIKGDAVEVLTEFKCEADAIRKAESSGFHDCDFKQGADICQRRLAWLAGEYLRSAIISEKGQIRCFILNHNMEWFYHV